MWFSWDNTVLLTAQAGCVALPGARVPPALERFRSGRWALVLPLSIAVVIGVIAAVPSTADVLTWVALLLVPPGCALALGWAARGARPWMALLAAPALALTWARPDTRAGQLAGLFLVAGSCVTLGRLLAGVTPATLLKAGIVAMAAVDAYLVFSNQLQEPNAVLVAASPPAPGCRSFSPSPSARRAWAGDLFVAAVLEAACWPWSADRSSRPPPRCSWRGSCGTSSSSSTTCCRRPSRRRWSCSAWRPSGGLGPSGANRARGTVVLLERRIEHGDELGPVK